MIIEDEPIEREVLKMMLENSNDNLEIRTCENGYKAIETLGSFTPQIVFVDINMPGINGLETIEAIKNQNVKAKFVILSSHDKFEFAQKAVKLGVEDYVLKPAKVSVLESIIKGLIDKIEKDKSSKNTSNNLEDKLKQIKPIIESNCVYELISTGCGENVDHYISFLEYKIQSAFCVVIKTTRNLKMALNNLKTELKNIGIHSIGECFNGIIVLFILSDVVLENKKKHQVGNFLSMMMQKYDKEQFFVGVGDIYVEIASMFDSYTKAVRAMNFARKTGESFCVFEENIDENNVAEDLKAVCFELVEEIMKSENNMLDVIADKIADRIIYGINSLVEAKENVFTVLTGVRNGLEQRLGGNVRRYVHRS